MMKKRPDTQGRQMMEPFMPGQLDMLSSQLNAGFGGGVEAQRGMLEQYTDPMKMMPAFKYNRGGYLDGGRAGGRGQPGMPDLTREQMQMARPWVPMNGNFRNPQQEIDFRALDPQVREWLMAQWGGGQ